MANPNLAYMFGGVFDEEENDEDLKGTFFNDLVALDLEKYQWRTGAHGQSAEKLNSTTKNSFQ